MLPFPDVLLLSVIFFSLLKHSDARVKSPLPLYKYSQLLLGRLICSFLTATLKNTALDQIIRYIAPIFLVEGMLQYT